MPSAACRPIRVESEIGSPCCRFSCADDSDAAPFLRLIAKVAERPVDFSVFVTLHPRIVVMEKNGRHAFHPIEIALNVDDQAKSPTLWTSSERIEFWESVDRRINRLISQLTRLDLLMCIQVLNERIEAAWQLLKPSSAVAAAITDSPGDVPCDSLGRLRYNRTAQRLTLNDRFFSLTQRQNEFFKVVIDLGGVGKPIREMAIINAAGPSATWE